MRRPTRESRERGAHAPVRAPAPRVGGGGGSEGVREAATFAALDALREINQLFRISARAAEQRTGLSGAQLFVLHELAQAPAESLNDLAARTVTRHSSVSAVVSRLVERGLVERAASAEDARRVHLRITRAGRALLRHAPESAQARLIAGARHLSHAQLVALAGSLTALVREMQASER